MRALALAGAASAVVILVGCGSSHVRIVGIETFPVPSGPGRLVATASELRAIQAAIPPRLPVNPPQPCAFGATVVMTVAGGRTTTYGPCKRPEAIERLRRALLRLPKEHPRTGYAGAAVWKAVLEDWYDGRMDQWHSCAAVREAMRHLPMDTPIYSTVRTDLESYAQAVC